MGLLQSPLSDALLSPRLRYLWYHSSLCWQESRTSWGLNEIFKLLWMGSRTVCVIHSPHPKRKKPPSYVDGKWFPLSAETLGSMEDPCKTAALLSLGKSVEVPSLKEEWRGSTGYLHLHWHPGDLCVRARVPLAEGTRACSRAVQLSHSLQEVSSIVLQARVSFAAHTSSCLTPLGLCHCTDSQGKTPWICLSKCWKWILSLLMIFSFSPCISVSKE